MKACLIILTWIALSVATTILLGIGSVVGIVKRPKETKPYFAIRSIVSVKDDSN